MLRHIAAVGLAGALGLPAAGGCAADFLPASVVVNERVIAVTAEPPEAVPGEQVTLTPTVVDPSGDLVEGTAYDATWWRCPDSDSDALGDFDQCTDPSARKNIATGAPYVDPVPADIFGELPPPGTTPGTDAALPADKILGAV